MFLCLFPRSPHEASSPPAVRLLPPLVPLALCTVWGATAQPGREADVFRRLWERGAQPVLSVCPWGAGSNRSHPSPLSLNVLIPALNGRKVP